MPQVASGVVLVTPQSVPQALLSEAAGTDGLLTEEAMKNWFEPSMHVVSWNGLPGVPGVAVPNPGLGMEYNLSQVSLEQGLRRDE